MRCEEQRGERGVGVGRVRTRGRRESESQGRDREGEGGRVGLRAGFVEFAGLRLLLALVGLLAG